MAQTIFGRILDFAKTEAQEARLIYAWTCERASVVLDWKAMSQKAFLEAAKTGSVVISKEPGRGAVLFFTTQEIAPIQQWLETMQEAAKRARRAADLAWRRSGLDPEPQIAIRSALRREDRKFFNLI